MLPRGKSFSITRNTFFYEAETSCCAGVAMSLLVSTSPQEAKGYAVMDSNGILCKGDTFHLSVLHEVSPCVQVFHIHFSSRVFSLVARISPCEK